MIVAISEKVLLFFCFVFCGSRQTPGTPPLLGQLIVFFFLLVSIVNGTIIDVSEKNVLTFFK